MNRFRSNEIINVALVSHAGAGKTSLAEAMLYESGASSRMGKVDEGTAITDYLPSEIKRKVTITSSLAPFAWKGKKINVVDTPGYSDFTGDVYGCIEAVDNVLMVVSGVSGIKVRTEILWNYLKEKKKPRMFFINKLDRGNSDFFRVLKSLNEEFSHNILPIWLPIGKGGSLQGYYDLISNEYFHIEGGSGDIELDDLQKMRISDFRRDLIEKIVECDDELLLRYLGEEELGEEELLHGLKIGILEGKLFPVLFGSATKNWGIGSALDRISAFLPTADKFVKGEKDAALVFKSLIDPFVGKINYIRVFNGEFKSGENFFNSNRSKSEKISSFMHMRGREVENIKLLGEGDIAVVAKLQNTSTGDTLTKKKSPVLLEGISFPKPKLAAAITLRSKMDEDRFASVISRMLEEDPTLEFYKNEHTGENILKGMGELHLEITKERIENTFGLKFDTAIPQIPYKETIRNKVKIQGRYKRQSDGSGQHGDVWLTLEPIEGETRFEENVFGGNVPRGFFPAIEKGVREAAESGAIAGFPITGVKVTLVDGSYHPIESNDMGFKLAAELGMKKGMKEGDGYILEPIMDVEVLVPGHYLGDIINDLNSKKGKILGMSTEGKLQKVIAQAPLREMMRYAVDLKTMTQGRGDFKMNFLEYREMDGIAAKRIEKAV